MIFKGRFLIRFLPKQLSKNIRNYCNLLSGNHQLKYLPVKKFKTTDLITYEQLHFLWKVLMVLI